ncbi:MAG TPA: MarP family serine protease [Acidimicrobiales bacterium]|jgi:S1-C subfamily serine protease|nr:MarP family serine protease [Acidimicrobiales bacterium]
MLLVVGVGGFDWVDAILIVLAILAAVRGFRLGAAMQVLSYGGFWLGLVVGAALAPLAVSHVTHEVTKAVVTLVVVFGAALVLGGLGRAVGGRLWRILRRIHLAVLDSGLGLAVAVVASMLASWLVALILVQGPSQTLAAGITNSRILRTMDAVLPSAPSLFNRVRSFVNTSGLPQVFAGLGPATAGPVITASGPTVQQAVRVAGPSMAEVVGAGCGQIQEGSGFVVAHDLVVTNAHVVAGIPNPVIIDRQGVRHAAQAIYFDPNFDLAVLRTTNLNEPPLPLDTSTVPRGAQGTVLGYPEGGPFTAVPAGVIQLLQAQAPNIYGQGTTTRPIYAIQAVVRPGNSGGPLVGTGGRVIGVVFSKSVSNPHLGYALASPQVAARVAQAEAHPSSPGTGACVSG